MKRSRVALQPVLLIALAVPGTLAPALTLAIAPLVASCTRSAAGSSAAGAGDDEAGGEAGAASEPSVVPVRTATIVRATLHGYVTAFGRVEPGPATAGAPAAHALVTAAVAGRIGAVSCVEGQHVAAGATLFQLDTRLADAQVEKLSATADFAQKNLARQQALLALDNASQKSVQEADEAFKVASAELHDAQTERSLLQITAPIEGTVTRCDGKLGQSVDTTVVLAELTALDRLVVVAGVPSAEAGPLQVGQAVEITAAHGVPPAHGAVTFIAPQVDAATDTVAVRVSLGSELPANAPATAPLRAGQLVQVRIVSAEHAGCLAVPVESVVRTADGSVIATVDGDTASQRPVTVGLRDGGLVEVAGGGLAEGQTVVTTGAYALPATTKVTVLPDK